MNVLFVCTANAARSQIAEGLARSLGTFAGVASAGTMPKEIHPLAVEVMDEVGIDIRSQYSKPLTQELVAWADVIVTLCGDARDNCPVLPVGKKHQHWGLPDPASSSGGLDERLKAFRDVRDAIAERLRSEPLFRPVG